MFPSTRKKPFVVAACLLCSAFVSTTAFAGPSPIGGSEIDGEYVSTNLGDQAEVYPVPFSLTNGSVTSPIQVSGFTVPDLSVEINGSGNTPTSLIIVPTAFILNGGAAGEVDFTIDSAFLASTNLIDGTLTLTSNTTTYDFSSFDSALLVLNFSEGVTSGGNAISFDPSWKGFTGPVPFEIIAVPEPASLAYMLWAGVFGAVGSWRRHPRKDEG